MSNRICYSNVKLIVAVAMEDVAISIILSAIWVSLWSVSWLAESIAYTRIARIGDRRTDRMISSGAWLPTRSRIWRSNCEGVRSPSSISVISVFNLSPDTEGKCRRVLFWATSIFRTEVDWWPDRWLRSRRCRLCRLVPERRSSIWCRPATLNLAEP